MGTFDIVIQYTGSAQYQAAFDTAAARWEQIITTDIPDIVSATYGNIDDLLIDASVIAIDGAGNILGQAGPDFSGRSSLLPSHGEIELDVADVTQMFNNGTLTNVIQHEIGHILGLGTLWSTLGLRSGFNYTGQSALAEYRTLSGNPSASSVPLQTGGGQGTAGLHWSESVFDSELMTGYSENGVMPLSRLTVGALRDLGYVADYTAADAYSFPGASGGGGTSVTWQTWAFGVTASDQVADVNGDGRTDLIQFWGGRAVVALSTGTSFGNWADWTQGVTASDRFGDFNGDGRADLLQIWDGRAVVALSTGTGFGPWTDWGRGLMLSDRVADVNGDGRADLIQFWDGRAVVALSTGVGFGSWGDWTRGITAGDRFGDFNGDQRADFLQIWDGRAVVALSTGTGFGPWTDWGRGAVDSELVGDVNGDGRADLVHHSSGRASVALSTGSNFAAWLDWGVTGMNSTARLAGVNGDSGADLVQWDQGRAMVALSALNIFEDSGDSQDQEDGAHQHNGSGLDAPAAFDGMFALQTEIEPTQHLDPKLDALAGFLV